MIYSPPASIDATGTSEVGDELNLWIAGVPDGETIDLRGGSYWCEHGLALGSNGHNYAHPHLPLQTKTYTTIVGNGARIFYTDVNREDPRRKWGTRLLHVFNGVSNLVTGVSLNGPLLQAKYTPALEAYHGIVLSGGKNNTFDGGSVTGVPGDFVYLSGGTEEVYVNNSQFDISGRQAFTLEDATDVSITNNRVRRSKRIILDCEPLGKSTVAHILFARNEIESVGLGFVHASPFAATLYNWKILENKIAKGHLTITIGGGTKTRSNGLQIEDNVSSDPLPYSKSRKPLMHVGHWTDVTIMGNVDTASKKAPRGISLVGCDGALAIQAMPGFA